MSRQQTSEAVIKAVSPTFDGFGLTATHSGKSEDIDTKRLLADATMLVSKRQALHSSLIVKAAQVLESAKAAPLGIVITK